MRGEQELERKRWKEGVKRMKRKRESMELEWEERERTLVDSKERKAVVLQHHSQYVQFRQ